MDTDELLAQMVFEPVWVLESTLLTCNALVIFETNFKSHIKRLREAVAKWFRALHLKSGSPWFKFPTLLPSGLVLSNPELNSSTALCKEPTGQPSTSWDS